MKDHAAFKNMEHGDRPFVKDAKTYGLDKPLPEVPYIITFDDQSFYNRKKRKKNSS
jgi:hypothetical protein